MRAGFTSHQAFKMGIPAIGIVAVLVANVTFIAYATPPGVDIAQDLFAAPHHALVIIPVFQSNVPCALTMLHSGTDSLP